MTAAPPPGRLLILDDDAAVGMTISAIAQALGFEVRSTTTAPDFFQTFHTWQPTHLALDLVMPDVDGIEVMRRLGQMQCLAALIITSGVGSRVLDAAQRSAMEHRLCLLGVLSKPFRANELRSLLQQSHTPDTTPEATPSAAGAPAISLEMLMAGLEQHQFSVWFQPKVWCNTGSLAGFEALVRWQHPQLGLIFPDCFIPLAEQSGLIAPLTNQIFEQALAWFAQSHFPNNTFLSLNISPKSLEDISLVERILARCQQHHLDPRRIILEITETSAMSDPITSLDLLTRFRIKGLRLSIDDFGVGYSSLVQLARLPFSELKIDKTFVISAPQSEESRTIIRAIIGLGHALGLRITAEGVETQAALTFLRELNCDLAQGYFIGKPMPTDAIAHWLSSSNYQLKFQSPSQ